MQNSETPNTQYEYPPSGLPELPPHYLPRPEDITILKLMLLSYMSKVAITGTTVRVGHQSIGGIGKTTLAIALTQDPEIQQTFTDGIIWITMGHMPMTTLKQAAVARRLGDTSGTYTDEHEGRTYLAHMLKDRCCLLVLDSVWEPEHISPFDVLGKRCRMLITTRDAELIQKVGAAEHRIYVFNDNQANRLLSRWTGVAYEKLPDTASRIARECGNVPLALSMLGAIIRANPTRWNSVLHRMRTIDSEKISRKFPDYPYPNQIQAISISVEMLERQVQQCYLALAIFPENTPIPSDVVKHLWSTFDIEGEEAEDILDLLTSRRLIAVDEYWNIMLHDVQRTYISKHEPNTKMLHRNLLESYKKTLPPAPIPWVYLPPTESYLWQYLTYHLLEAGLHDELKTLLFSFDWIQAKLNATDINAVIADYDRCQHLNFESAGEADLDEQLSSLDSLFLDFDPELPLPNTPIPTTPPHHLVRDGLRIAAPVLIHHKEQLAAQLTGRLASLEDSPNIQTMLEQIDQRQDGQPWLKPSTASLTPPGRRLLRTIESYSDVPVAVALTAYGRYAITASDLTIKIWDMDFGDLLATLEGHTDRVWAIAITPDGKQAISSSADTTLKVWDVDKRRLIGTLKGHTAGVWSVSITPDGQTAISASDDHTLKLWNLQTMQLVVTLESHEDRVRSVALTADGKYAISASNDTTLKLWDIENRTLLTTLAGHTDWVRTVCITPDGKWAVSGSVDRSIHVWDIPAQRIFTTLEGHSKEIIAVAITPDGRKIVSASADQTLKVWHVERQKLLRTLEGHTAGVNGVALTIDGQRAVSTSYDSTLRQWNIGRVQIPSSIEGHSAGVTAIAIPTHKQWIITGSHDATLKLWNPTTGALLATLQGHHSGVNILALHPDNTRVLSTSYNEPLHLWDIEQQTLLATLDTNDDWVMALTILPDGNQAVTVTDDYRLTFWDLDQHQRLHTLELEHHPGTVTAIAAIPTSDHLLLATDEGTLHSYDLTTGKIHQTLEGHTESINSLALSQDGSRLLTGSADMTLRLWDVHAPALLHTYQQHTAVNCVAIIADGSRMLSTATDGLLTVWDGATQEPLTTFSAESPLLSCAIIDTIIVAGEESGRIHFLHLCK